MIEIDEARGRMTKGMKVEVTWVLWGFGCGGGRKALIEKARVSGRLEQAFEDGSNQARVEWVEYSFAG